ncbi:MAG: SBBP repeat-containing protein [Promethearchaeota archaeon]
MKKKSSILMILILILYFSALSPLSNIFLNERTQRAYKNITPVLSISDSAVYEWNRTWGGTGYDIGWGVATDSSNNIYSVGMTESFGTGLTDMVLVKYDDSGVQQWNQTWGGNETDIGYGVVVDSSNNIYSVGMTLSFGKGNEDLILVKFDSSGVQQWNRTWGGSGLEECVGVAVDSLDNIYLTGDTNSFGAGTYDMILIKYDSSGVQQWNRTWGAANVDTGIGLAVDSSDHIYISGYTRSFGAGATDAILVKYDSFGEQQWNLTWGGAQNDNAYGIIVDSNDNIYLAGGTDSFGAGYLDAFLIKYDASGVQQWNRTWGGSFQEQAFGLALDSSGNIYLTGSTGSFGMGDGDMFLLKYDSSGVLQWNITWGGIFPDTSFAISIDSEDNVYLEGYIDTIETLADMVTVKFSKPQERVSPGVPGFNLIVVISSMSLIVIIMAKKKIRR